MTTADTAPVLPPNSRSFLYFNAALSSAVVLFLGWLLYGRTSQPAGSTLDLRFMPSVNACLNATSAVLLTCGWVAIRKKRPDIHRYFMVSSTAVSALFLVGYVAYHAVHGDTKIGGTGAIRVIYFVILVSHIIGSVVALPLLISALTFAAKRSFVRHRKVTRVLAPLWLYVSVTGVSVFFFLRQWGLPH